MKFRNSQPISLVLQDKAWCAWHGATETLCVFPHSPGAACGSGQVTEFVAQWFDTVWQILLVPSAGCSVPVVCEHWQNVLAGKGGDLESSRSLIFQSFATQSCKWWIHQCFAHNLVYGSQIGFYRAEDKRPEELFQQVFLSLMCRADWKKERNFVFEMVDRKKIKPLQTSLLQREIWHVAIDRFTYPDKIFHFSKSRTFSLCNVSFKASSSCCA